MISVVFPVHDEASYVAEVLAAHSGALERIGQPYEFVLVPNGCRDRSVEVCTALAEKGSRVRVIALERAGWGSAVRAGLMAASGQHLCYTNLARTSSDDLVRVLEFAMDHPDAVVKARRQIRQSLLRRAGSWLYNLECWILFGVRCGDVNGTPKVFSRAHTALLALQRDDDLIDLELAVTCRRRRYPILEVPIRSTRRHGGRSTTRLNSALRMYREPLRMWWADRRGARA